MNRTLVLVILAAFAACSNAQENSIGDFDYSEVESRLLFSNANTTSVTIGYYNFALGTAAVLGLLALLAFGLFYAAGDYSGSSYGYSGYADYGSGYARKSSFDPYAIDWEKFSILDWVSIGEEAWRKFDPADLDCQKRLICEIHQNTDKFGAAASKMVDLFSYLQYAEVLSLPDEFKALVEEYLDAADRGRTLKKECGEVYDTCDFSVKKIFDKYSHNEI